MEGSVAAAPQRLESVLSAQKDVLERIVRGDDLADALDQLVRWIEATSESDVAGSVLLLEDATRLRHCVAPRLPLAYIEAIDGVAIGPAVGSCGTAAYRGEAVVVTDIATDPLWADYRELALEHGLRACWSTPILGGDGEVLGTFAMYYPEPRQPPVSDYELVEVCVRTASIAISRAQVERADRRTRERLRLALAAGGLGAWEWDMRTGTVTWDPMLEAIYGLQPGEFSGSLDDYRARIHPDDAEASQATVRAAQAAEAAYETEHRVVHPDGTVRWTHGWAAPRFDDEGLAGYTGVVADVTERKRADEERERLLRSEAAARAEAERARDRLAVTARTLQRSLLPPVPPAIPGVEVATCYHAALDGLEVGGDFYDLPQLTRQTWALAIGDVCGKGAEAAGLTALVRYATRTAATQVGSPTKVLQMVNDVLRRDQAGEAEPRFATMLFARLRPTPGAVHVAFATGGHPLPLVLRADGRVEQPGRPGQLLGVFDAIKASTHRVELGPGDALISFTDGVVEARDAQGRELGDDLATLLRPHAGAPAALLASVIEEAALQWAPSGPRDDIAIVVVRKPEA